MAIARAYWKGYLKLSLVSCPIALYTGTSSTERVSFHPQSGVDIGFTQGGIAKFPEANNVVMLASLYYVPMWVFYRSSDTLTQINELRGRRVAIVAHW